MTFPKPLRIKMMWTLVMMASCVYVPEVGFFN